MTILVTLSYNIRTSDVFAGTIYRVLDAYVSVSADVGAKHDIMHL